MKPRGITGFPRPLESPLPLGQRLQREIDAALAQANPAHSNRLITAAHHHLGKELHRVLGSNSGGNFHAWATWGSVEAGEGIRMEDVPFAPWLARLPPVRTRLETTAQALLWGNQLVLGDIGRASARFIEMFDGQKQPSAKRLERFLATLRPEDSRQGGQSLLRQAFTHYHQAKFEENPKRKAELMLLGNLEALLHEHLKLQPLIDQALPDWAATWMTRHHIRFRVGPREVAIGRDVPSRFPPELATIRHPELLRFLATYDKTPNSTQGSRAKNWEVLEERMNFAADLFRVFHFDAAVYADPLATGKSG